MRRATRTARRDSPAPESPILPPEEDARELLRDAVPTLKHLVPSHRPALEGWSLR
jgi:hypothetical protein